MIYFAQTPTGSIKIGFSEDVEARMSQLGSRYGAKPALLATMPGDRSAEAEIHARFAHHRLGTTEQFRPGADLMEFIDKPPMVDVSLDAIEAAPDPITAKVDREVYNKAFAVARARNVPVAEILSEVLRAPINRMFEQEMRRAVAEGGDG